MTTSNPFNSRRIANALLATGLSVNEVAFRVHMPFKTLQQIVEGATTPIDVRVTTLERLAEAINLPLRSLFTPPKGAPDPEEQGKTESTEAAADATTVIAVLYDRGTNPTINTDLAKGLGWTLQRLNTAYDEAERRLAPAGLRLTRTHGEGSIGPATDRANERAAVEHARADNTGLSVDTYQAAYQAHDRRRRTPRTCGLPPTDRRRTPRQPRHRQRPTRSVDPDRSGPGRLHRLTRPEPATPRPAQGRGVRCCPCGQTTRSVTGDTHCHLSTISGDTHTSQPVTLPCRYW